MPASLPSVPPSDGRRIGVMGGTFDPPHLGHLQAAETARAALGLASVRFVPAGEPWLKAGRRITPAAHRLRMVALAIAGNPYFALCDWEVRRAGPSYTVDTLERLRRELPSDADLYFIVGSDVLPDFHRWHRPERVLELCRLAVVGRPGRRDDDKDAVVGRPGRRDDDKDDDDGDDDAGIRALASHFPQALAAGAVVRTPGSAVACSASELRQALAAGRAPGCLIPDAVAAYIARQGLYRSDTGIAHPGIANPGIIGKEKEPKPERQPEPDGGEL